MSKSKKKAEAPVTDDILDAELQELIGDATTSEIEVEPAANDEEIDLEQIEAEAVAEETRREAYAEQQQDEEQEGSAPAAASNVTPIAAKSRSPRVSRAAGAKASQVLASVMDDESMLKAACLVSGDVEDPELVDQLKSDVDNLAKKVGDKAVNLLRFHSVPNKLQNYTRLGLEHLVKNGSTSSADLTKLLQGAGYTVGTARSQANQLMSLFPTLKVANRAGKTLTLNEDSTIVESFKSATA